MEKAAESKEEGRRDATVRMMGLVFGRGGERQQRQKALRFRRGRERQQREKTLRFRRGGERQQREKGSKV